MEIIEQTNRTILFDVVNPEVFNMFNIMSDVDENSKSLTDEKVAEINNALLVKNFDDFLKKNKYPVIFMATTKSKKLYTDVQYQQNDYIMFGKESAGIPEEILLQYPQTSVRIPMFEQARSLNLSNAVAVLLYEALRQQNFDGLLKQGQLHRHTW